MTWVAMTSDYVCPLFSEAHVQQSHRPGNFRALLFSAHLLYGDVDLVFQHDLNPTENLSNIFRGEIN